MIKELEERFSNLQKQLSAEMTANSEVTPEESLTLLPIALQREYYKKLIEENLDTLEKADSIRKIFYRLNIHFTFIDYGLLEHLVGVYGSRELKEQMSQYVEDVQVFFDKTTVEQLMNHWPGKHDIPPNFEKLKVLIDKDPKSCTLRKLDDLRKKFCSEIKLSETVFVVIGIGRRSSFILRLAVPYIFLTCLESRIGDLKSFYEREDIVSVTVGRRRMYSVTVSC